MKPIKGVEMLRLLNRLGFLRCLEGDFYDNGHLTPFFWRQLQVRRKLAKQYGRTVWPKAQ